MNVFEAVGALTIVFFTCVGLYTVARLVIEGIKRVAGRIDIGQTTEDAAVRDFLSIKEQIR